MPKTETLLLFSIAACIANTCPGPSMFYVMSVSSHKGRKAGLLSAFGLAIGLLFHVVAASLGVTAVFKYSPIAFTFVKYTGAAYLIYIGIQTLRNNKSDLPSTEEQAPKTQKLFYQGILTEVLNPKTSLFFISFLPQFTDPLAGPISFQTFLLGMIFVVIGFSRDIAIALASSLISMFFKQSPIIEYLQRLVSGSILILIGIKLAFSEKN